MLIMGGAHMPWFTWGGPVFTCHPSIMITVPWFTLKCPSLVIYYLVGLVIGRDRGFTRELLFFPSPMLVSHVPPISPEPFVLAPEIFLIFSMHCPHSSEIQKNSVCPFHCRTVFLEGCHGAGMMSLPWKQLPRR